MRKEWVQSNSWRKGREVCASLERMDIPTRPRYRKETGMMAVHRLVSLLCGEILAKSRCCSPGRLNTFFSPGFKVSGAGSREEDFQRLSWWGKVWVIKHWKYVRVLKHLGAAPTDCTSAKPNRSTSRDRGGATSLNFLRNAQRSREAG